MFGRLVWHLVLRILIILNGISETYLFFQFMGVIIDSHSLYGKGSPPCLVFPDYEKMKETLKVYMNITTKTL